MMAADPGCWLAPRSAEKPGNDMKVLSLYLILSHPEPFLCSSPALAQIRLNICDMAEGLCSFGR